MTNQLFLVRMVTELADDVMQVLEPSQRARLVEETCQAPGVAFVVSVRDNCRAIGLPLRERLRKILFDRNTPFQLRLESLIGDAKTARAEDASDLIGI